MMQTMEGVRRLTLSDMNGRPPGQMDPRYRWVKSNHQSISMSKSLPVNPPKVITPQDDIWHSSQSLTGRTSVMTYNHRQYPSATAALSDYISDYESQNSSQDSQSRSPYRRTVSDLLLPKTSLQKTVQRSLDTGDRDTKDEFHRFNVRKLIDDSYEQILRADLEQGKASAIVATAKHLGTESTLSFEDAAPQEKEFLDSVSEISSSTDALLLANPYIVNFSHLDRKLHHGGMSSSKSIDSARLPIASSYARQRHLRSRGRMNDSRQQTRPAPINSKDQRPHPSFDGTNFLRTSHHEVVSPKHSVYDRRQELRKAMPSRSDGRPIPAWVSDLDNSLASQKSLDTLYTDTLLVADGHALSHQDSMRQSQMNRASMLSANHDQRMRSLSLQGQLEERPMSVMSGARPAPSWVEDLDTTVGSLSGSLRMLGKKMEHRSTRAPRVNYQDVPTNRYGKTGYSGQQSREVSRPASLQSEIGQPKATSSHFASELRYRKGDSMNRNTRKGRVTSDLDFTKDRMTGQRHHRRTQSASTVDLIKESPYGDAVSAPSSNTIKHRLHLLRQSKGRAQANHTDKPSRVSTLKTSTHTTMPSARAARQGHLPSSSLSFSKSNPEQSKMKAHLNVSTTTDSLIYSSPFGLDRDMPFPDLTVLPPAYDQSNHPSAVRNSGIDGTMKEGDLASSLSSLSSITLETDHLMNEKAARSPLIADHVSESTVGETARTNAMLRRANRIMDNTQASLNMSSHLEQNAHTPESSDTEELLAGDQELMTRVQTRLRAEGDAPTDPATQKMLDHFLEDCILSSGRESPEISEERTSEGPLESLKNMLFKLQDMASLNKEESGRGTNSQQLREPLSGGGKKTLRRHSATSTGGTGHLASSIKHPPPSSLSSSPSVLLGDGEKDSTFASTSQSRITKSVSFQSQKNFEEEPGGQSLQRAMKHLSRLKTLVAMDTASTSSS